MNSVFEFNPSALAQPLLIATLVAVALLTVAALRSPHLLRIGLRNVPRRPLRTTLVVFGLMLATTFVAAAISVDNTIVQAVKTVAVYNLGRVDEAVTRHGSNGTFPEKYGERVVRVLAGDPRVDGVAPALTMDELLVADETSRQVRGKVTGLALETREAGPLADFRSVATGKIASPDALGDREVYLNRALAQMLNARPGDSIYLYSKQWPGERYGFTVRDVITGGITGSTPQLVAPLPVLQTLMAEYGAVSAVYIANHGEGLAGLGYSDGIRDTVDSRLPPFLHTRTVKADGVQFALQAEDVFGRILTLFTLFAFAIGLMLIFLIFTLLAAERRAELGMARAVGMRRGHVVRMLLFEGATYDATAALLGMLAGLGLGVAIVKLVSPVIARLGFPLDASVQPAGMAVAFCLGALFTLLTILLAAWTVSRLTVASALRDLPEPPPPQESLVTLARHALMSTRWTFRESSRPLAAWGRLAGGIISRGWAPLAAGVLLAQSGAAAFDALLFSLGVTLAIVGVALIARWALLALVTLWMRRSQPVDAVSIVSRVTTRADRIAALAAGLGVTLYWSAPYRFMPLLGAPYLEGTVMLLFVAGLLMVFGAVVALAPNIDLLLLPVRWLLRWVSRARHVAAMAFVYPSSQRFRTGIGLALFSLVCFTMVVMASISASVTQRFDNIPADTAGYDVAGQALFSPVGDVAHIKRALGTQSSLAAISSAAPVPLGVIQPGAPEAGWRVYPGVQIDGSFLSGVGLPLAARARGYATDADVWRAVRDKPGSVVIDAGALGAADAAGLGLRQPPPVTALQFLNPPIAAGMTGIVNLETLDVPSSGGGSFDALGALANDPGLITKFQLRLRRVIGAGGFEPTQVWMSDLRGSSVHPVTIIGVVDNVRGQRYGLFGSTATFAPVEQRLPAFGNEYYYFKVKPGADSRTEALRLGSLLLEHGFETTVIQDALLDVSGPSIFISRVLIGLVGLTLLVGMAALAVTGSRAVVERRQQIGMLRALGFRRAQVQMLFLIESVLVGTTGTLLGAGLGLLLARQLFQVDFFSSNPSGLTLIVPWRGVALICVVAVAAAVAAALLPAWQAGRVSPADALRYE